MAITRRQSQNMGPSGGGVAAFGDGGIDAGGTCNLDVVTCATSLTVGGVAVPLANVTAIPLNEFKAPAAWKDDLGDTATAAILGLADTTGSLLKTTASNGDSISQSAVACFVLPPTYVSGAAITVRVRAKKDTTLGTVTDTVDVVAKVVGDTLGSDICTTAAQVLTTSYVDYDFTVTPTSRVAGDILAIEVFGITNDTGGTTNKQVFISRVEMRLAAA